MALPPSGTTNLSVARTSPRCGLRAGRGERSLRVTLVLDSGALIALERDERPMWTRLKGAQQRGELPVTHAGVLGQVWRSTSRQAQLARALQGIDIRPIDKGLGRAVGVLLGRADMSDVIDAAVVLLSADGDDIITSGPGDLSQLAAASGLHVELLHP